MAYKITGRVLQIGQTQSVPTKSGGTYDKRDIVITVRKYDPFTGEPREDLENTPKFTFGGERCRDLDGVNPGDPVTIHFEITGRSYMTEKEKRFFTEARPLRLERCGRGSVAEAEAKQFMTVDPEEIYNAQAKEEAPQGWEKLYEGADAPKKGKAPKEAGKAGTEEEEDLPF